METIKISENAQETARTLGARLGHDIRAEAGDAIVMENEYMSLRVAITRTLPEATHTADRVRALGAEAVLTLFAKGPAASVRC